MIRKMLTFVPLIAFAVSACQSDSGGAGGSGGGNGGNGGGGNGGGGTGPVTCAGNKIVANEANNYRFSSTITLSVSKVKPKSNLLFKWGETTADLIRHSIDPKKDLNTILVFHFSLTPKQLETKLNTDDVDATIQGVDTVVLPPLTLTTNGSDTEAHLLDFTLNGAPVGSPLLSEEDVMNYFNPEFYDPAKHTYAVMAATGDVLGQGTKMIQAFVLDPNTNDTTVTMTKDSIKLNFEANLTSLKPTGVPTGEGKISIDWSKMSENALGNDFSGVEATRITTAFVARYSETPAELSDETFLDLEIIADKLYRKRIEEGTSADLSAFEDSNGSKFSGIDGEGTWLLGLQCGDCRNPAPWYITVLKPCQ